MNNPLNIVWEKCHHGVEKRSFIPCEKCRQEREQYKNLIFQKGSLKMTRVAIKRGCRNEECFCDGTCHEIIGYRDPLPGEKPNA